LVELLRVAGDFASFDLLSEPGRMCLKVVVEAASFVSLLARGQVVA
jgi:hypothetical protein